MLVTRFDPAHRQKYLTYLHERVRQPLVVGLATPPLHLKSSLHDIYIGRVIRYSPRRAPTTSLDSPAGVVK